MWKQSHVHFLIFIKMMSCSNVKLFSNQFFIANSRRCHLIVFDQKKRGDKSSVGFKWASEEAQISDLWNFTGVVDWNSLENFTQLWQSSASSQDKRDREVNNGGDLYQDINVICLSFVVVLIIKAFLFHFMIEDFWLFIIIIQALIRRMENIFPHKL